MASSSYSGSSSDGREEDEVVVQCREQEDEADENVKANFSEITISTAQNSAWNLPAILSRQVVRVKASRSRLIELSSYFRRSGSFSVKDAVIRLTQTLRMWRSNCMGHAFPGILKYSMPNLRTLKLGQATWMTNRELKLMTHNFPNLVELTLIGCRNLNADSLQIISYGWTSLAILCLEDCGGITSKGACSLFNCKSLENLLLRHNGSGINRTFILDAVSALPMLRSVSLDCCDANEGDFDLPLFNNRCYLSNVNILRCELQNCTFGLLSLGARRRPVHKETLVWNSLGLQRTVVKERVPKHFGIR